ncbi:hypothetical protein P0D91_03450 [Pseudomonas sp. CBSPBW29]|uniref:hypothetical protein n=1 Tax=Pseudomonas TaxID=286 RepID=UPI0021ABD12E|nr:MULTISPECIES: hypothetical protein [unclassified Pseudomonas]WEL43418.1 hypothetical protein P0D91_03450 [Pseudomonas sp. CBSPBW29]WEL64481.1 hypothetical protein P0D93_31000 [Pseudomonas sp. CBSPGW29]WEL73666.1 hypothetical protein P0D94_16920 [Pseudomonas sp. CBSPCGW29]WEL80779.1 hypothetical protein P0D95_22825 [Pseudomonas sp. CBSPCAW29]UVH51960.1 hypothetical protein NVB75_03640 [Pseudomonas sp. CBS]
MSRAPEKNADCPTANNKPLLVIHNLAPVITEDEEATQSDGGLGLRHVEHDVKPTLYPEHRYALGTEIFLYWDSPIPEDFAVINSGNQDHLRISLRVDKKNVLPTWAYPYLTVQEPRQAPVESNHLKVRIKLDRPGGRDPDPDTVGHQGFVFRMPPDLQAGEVVTRHRAVLGIILDVEPYLNMAEFDTCNITWGSQGFSHVVRTPELGRPLSIKVPTEVVLDAGSSPHIPVSMQVIDAVGNYPAVNMDPDSDANWSPITWVNVDLDAVLNEPPSLERELPSGTTRIGARGAGSPWSAPQVLEAEGGRLDPNIAKATVVFTAPAGWDAPMQMRLVWEADTTIYIQEHTLDEIPEDRTIVLTVDGAQLKTLANQLTELYYERIEPLPAHESLRLELQVGEPVSRLPQAQVEHAQGEHQVTVIVPFTETAPGDTVTLQWIASQSRTTVTTTLNADTAGQPMRVTISVEGLQMAEIVKVYYSLDRNGQLPRYSKLQVWEMGSYG